uniref:Chemosensory protein 21 n=1 Tax=Agrilus planipennis TaxID=224129 RepID=A0A890UKL1_AGRPL|nr:chemosensory protein 21 [Agrilus planipennis]
MSAINVFCLLAIAFTLAVVLEAMPQKDLSAKYENLDVDAILKNKRTLNSYIKCVLDQGPCTPEGRDLKENINKNLATKCAECTVRQKQIVRKATRFVMKNNPEDWQKIVKHYDPDNKYIAGFTEFVNRDD